VAVTTLLTLIAVVKPIVLSQQPLTGAISGTVRDQAGASIAGAHVAILHSQQAVLRNTTSDTNGHFKFEEMPPGAYEIRITQFGFGTHRLSAKVGSGRTDVDIILELAPVSSQVTVTAETGMAQDKDRIPQAVNVISDGALQQRATAVLAQVADFRFVVDAHAGSTPLTGTTRHHQSYENNESEGAI